MSNDKLEQIVREAWLNAETESHVIRDICSAIRREFPWIDWPCVEEKDLATNYQSYHIRREHDYFLDEESCTSCGQPKKESCQEK